MILNHRHNFYHFHHSHDNDHHDHHHDHFHHSHDNDPTKSSGRVGKTAWRSLGGQTFVSESFTIYFTLAFAFTISNLHGG